MTIIDEIAAERRRHRPRRAGAAMSQQATDWTADEKAAAEALYKAMGWRWPIWDVLVYNRVLTAIRAALQAVGART